MQDACAKGANLVLLTPIGRRYFDEAGKRKDDHSEYPGVVKQVAQAQKVPLIDLHETSWAMCVFLYNYKWPHLSCNMQSPNDAHASRGPLEVLGGR